MGKDGRRERRYRTPHISGEGRREIERPGEIAVLFLSPRTCERNVSRLFGPRPSSNCPHQSALERGEERASPQ